LGAKTSGTGMELLLIIDTDIFIDHFRGIKEATEYLRKTNVLERATTDINVMELFAGANDLRELNNLEQFIFKNQFNVLPVTDIASRLAVELLKKYRLSNNLRMPDALIAGIVLEIGASLVTGNKKHFQFIPNLRLVTPHYR
jgi:predicted nucleic acid-binding protein